MAQPHSDISPKEGDKAPSFELPAVSGADIQAELNCSLHDYAKGLLVLYFYPKDLTSGCTVEANEFNENLASFAAENCSIVGVSKDSIKRHKKFIEAHNLAFTLASDEAGEMLQSYGVWVEKSMYGKKYMGIDRATFIIDQQGNIVHVWRKVKVKGHVDAVLDAVRTLNNA
ncbi:MAG: peroxiredoxin [Alphaproteobacteria bacterium]